MNEGHMVPPLQNWRYAYSLPLVPQRMQISAMVSNLNVGGRS